MDRRKLPVVMSLTVLLAACGTTRTLPNIANGGPLINNSVWGFSPLDQKSIQIRKGEWPAQSSDDPSQAQTGSGQVRAGLDRIKAAVAQIQTNPNPPQVQAGSNDILVGSGQIEAGTSQMQSGGAVDAGREPEVSASGDSSWNGKFTQVYDANEDNYLPLPCARYAPPLIPNLDTAAPSGKIDSNGTACIFAMKTQVDQRFQEWTDGLLNAISDTNLALDMSTLGLSSAGALLSGASAKIISSVSGAVSGTKSAIDSDVLYNTTVKVLVMQMDKDRSNIATTIEKKLSGSSAKYTSVYEAWNDLEAYDRAGTFTSALVNLQSDTGASKNDCEKQLTQQKRSSGGTSDSTASSTNGGAKSGGPSTSPTDSSAPKDSSGGNSSKCNSSSSPTKNADGSNTKSTDDSDLPLAVYAAEAKALDADAKLVAANLKRVHLPSATSISAVGDPLKKLESEALDALDTCRPEITTEQPILELGRSRPLKGAAEKETFDSTAADAAKLNAVMKQPRAQYEKAAGKLLTCDVTCDSLTLTNEDLSAVLPSASGSKGADAAPGDAPPKAAGKEKPLQITLSPKGFCSGSTTAHR